jgi:hypothetical protein
MKKSRPHPILERLENDLSKLERLEHDHPSLERLGNDSSKRSEVVTIEYITVPVGACDMFRSKKMQDYYKT